MGFVCFADSPLGGVGFVQIQLLLGRVGRDQVRVTTFLPAAATLRP